MNSSPSDRAKPSESWPTTRFTFTLIEGHLIKIEDSTRLPRFHDREPRSHDREPRSRDREPQSRDREPRSHDREPRSRDHCFSTVWSPSPGRGESRCVNVSSLDDPPSGLTLAIWSRSLTHRFRASLKHKDELTKIRYKNQVLCKYRVDPQRAGLSLIAELTWSNLGLKRVLNKRK